MSALAPLGPEALRALADALRDSRAIRARRELQVEGQPVPGSMLIVRGWAARIRILLDGRRQLLSFLVPGDLIGLCRQCQPLAVSTIVTITDIGVCPAPPPDDFPDLAEAYAVSHALDEAHLLAHIARLGRLSAQERVGDLLLEFHTRLKIAGLVKDGSFDLPLTQELLADALGLTPVHTNRMLQQSRRDGDLVLKAGRVTLTDPAALAARLGSAPPTVAAVTLCR